jgi:hypothetical protein
VSDPEVIEAAPQEETRQNSTPSPQVMAKALKDLKVFEK